MQIRQKADYGLENEPLFMPRHIFLVGYRGSGKTIVGQRLGCALQRPTVDTDQLVQEAAGKTIREIFAESGEAAFRELECAAIDEASRQDEPKVISLGGGAVLRESNRQLIAARGLAIWLKAAPSALFRRIAADAATLDQRPQLSSLSGYAEIEEVLAIREPLYRQVAQKIVATDGKNPDEVVAEIANWINSATHSNHS